jgi:hypothetical protein
MTDRIRPLGQDRGLRSFTTTPTLPSACHHTSLRPRICASPSRSIGPATAAIAAITRPPQMSQVAAVAQLALVACQ